MFFVRLLLGLIALPFIIVAYVLKFVFYIFVVIGNITANVLGSIMIIGGIIMFITGDSGAGIGALVGGAVLFAAPISAVLS